jgi:transcriptional regulator with XRE-family HTH domain
MLKVKAERLRRHWTQTTLGYHAKLSASEVSRIESGRTRPYPRQAARLARALDLDPAELLTPADAPQGNEAA